MKKEGQDERANMAGSWFRRLKDGLKKSAQSLGDGIRESLLGGISGRLTEDQLDTIFETLIQGDVGVAFAEKVCERLRSQKFESPEAALKQVAQEIANELRPFAQPFGVPSASSSKRPHVILVSGVNGSGKTTSIAKLTYLCQQQGLSVAWAACDTFRAAATDQLRVWAERLGVPVDETYPGHGERIDPASLAYYALEKATQNQTNVLFIDTAGRLHNNEALMNELSRIVKVIRKIDPTAPNQSLLVLDGTTGQNALVQVELFQKYVPLTGLILTKLDGTSRAGFFVALCQKLQLPVVAVGVGEQIDAMNALNPDEFASALVGV